MRGGIIIVATRSAKAREVTAETPPLARASSERGLARGLLGLPTVAVYHLEECRSFVLGHESPPYLERKLARQRAGRPLAMTS